ncbi:MAG: hypothetical protein HC876_20570 [Chloroflexaceae bacterium]|nr:hypothetical protein [Chloroflexaceae bacterium]NJO07718.1 hypothetical protein [Chloroflexaceae bacterium]
MNDLIINGIAALLTLCVFSRVIGDNRVFRAVQYLFVGVSLGYSFVVLYHQVLLPRAVDVVESIEIGNTNVALIAGIPFVLLLLLIPRVIEPMRGLSWLANYPLGIIFGIGGGLSLIGALVGTLRPQVLTTLPTFTDGVLTLVGGLVLVFGVIFTLTYFFFTESTDTRFGRITTGMARVGRWLLIVTFGFFFAGALLTYLTALSERFNFLVSLLPI